jgi:hypothetical protein
VPRHKKRKVIVELKVALDQADSRGELNHLRATIVQSVPPSRAVIEDLIRELEWESPARWGPVLERLRDVVTPEQALG